MKENWLEVKIYDDDRRAVDDAVYVLAELGANGICEGEGFLTAYFPKAAGSADALRCRITKGLRPFIAASCLRIEVGEYADSGWETSWRQWFKPFEIVPHVIVKPSWESFEAEPGDASITIDPGMAFGTGLHPTTRLCAMAIHGVISKARGISLLDVGCGSGILSIVARKLGCRKISCVDNDPQALDVAAGNFALNGCSDIERHESMEDVGSGYDVVVANILLNTLIMLKSDIKRCLKCGGYLILSGITVDQQGELISHYGMEVESISNDDEWSCVVLKG